MSAGERWMRNGPVLLLVSCLLVAPMHAVAQPSAEQERQRMMQQFADPAAMQKMAAQAEAMSQCMESIDRSKLEALQKRAETAAKEIEALCKAGKKTEALAKGIALSREMNANPTVTKMRECSKGFQDAMPGMPWQMTQPRAMKDEKEPTRDDICS